MEKLANNTKIEELSSSNEEDRRQGADFSLHLFERALERVDKSLAPSDELPAFAIKSLSPTGRSLSPIDNDQSDISETSLNEEDSFVVDVQEQEHESHNESFLSLEEINSQIGPQPLSERNHQNLETIFEGVFLETPPKKNLFRNAPDAGSCPRSCNFLDGKENRIRREERSELKRTVLRFSNPIS